MVDGRWSVKPVHRYTGGSNPSTPTHYIYMKLFDKIRLFFSRNKKEPRTVEFSSELIIISDEIDSRTSEEQLVKIEDKYYKVKELG
jgi:hypothetical protein